MGTTDEHRLMGSRRTLTKMSNCVLTWQGQGHYHNPMESKAPLANATRTPREQGGTGRGTASNASDIYFVQMEIADRPIKIGRSIATGRRFRMLQCGSPYPLTCIGLLYGEGEWEGRWHERFRDQRLFGEWFRETPELIEAIHKAIEVGSREALGIEAPINWRAALGIPEPVSA